MTSLDKPGAPSGSSALTIAAVGILALVAAAGTLFCVVYSVWWLVVYWAPF